MIEMLWIHQQSWDWGLAPTSKVWQGFGARWLEPDTHFGDISVSWESLDTKVFLTFTPRWQPLAYLLYDLSLTEFLNLFSKCRKSLHWFLMTFLSSFVMQTQVPKAERHLGANSPAYFPCLGPHISKLSVGLLNLTQVSTKISRSLEGARIGSINIYWDSRILSEYK